VYVHATCKVKQVMVETRVPFASQWWSFCHAYTSHILVWRRTRKRLRSLLLSMVLSWGSPSLNKIVCRLFSSTWLGRQMCIKSGKKTNEIGKYMHVVSMYSLAPNIAGDSSQHTLGIYSIKLMYMYFWLRDGFHNIIICELCEWSFRYSWPSVIRTPLLSGIR